MPEQTMQAWMSLYAGVGLTAALCMAIALLKTVHDYRSGAHVLRFATWPDRILAVPKLWLRANLNYLSGAPVVGLIALAYAHHIGFAVLGSV